MRIRFIHSVQAVGGKAFAKGDVVDASEIPANYRAAWLAGGSAEEVNASEGVEIALPSNTEFNIVKPIILAPDIPLMPVEADEALPDQPEPTEEE